MSEPKIEQGTEKTYVEELLEQLKASNEEAGKYRSLLYGCDKHRLWNGLSCVGCVEEENKTLRAQLEEAKQVRDLNIKYLDVANKQLTAANVEIERLKEIGLVVCQDAQTCMDNSHWEVKFGSADLSSSIKQFKDLTKPKGVK